MAEIPTIDIPDLQFVDVPPGRAPAGETIKRMVDILKTGTEPPASKPDIGAAFSRGANLSFEGEPTPIFPKNPVPSGTPRKGAKPPYRTTGRPPGAEDLQGLCATGLILIFAFAIGDWAAPTVDEAQAISAPLANILARRIDLAAKLGRDASDTIALAVALLAYTARVGPIAAERIREGVDNRRRRERVVREPSTYRPDDGGGEGSMAVGVDAGASSGFGAAYHPFDALAKARNNGLDVLDRDLGGASRTDPSVGDQRS